MTNPARIRITRLLALLFVSFGLAGMPAAATAQILQDQPQTKEEAKEARDAAADSGSSNATSSTASDSSSIAYPLIGLGFVIFAGTTWWMLRDASDAVGDTNRRAAPGRPLPDDSVGRGAPKNLFTGEGEPGGKVGKRKKRDQGKRQRNARKANRPR